jgi:hypothetical protein
MAAEPVSSSTSPRSLALDVEGQGSVVGPGCTAMALTDRPHAYSNPGDAPVHFTMVVHEPPSSS